jgi:hypothetical protein
MIAQKYVEFETIVDFNVIPKVGLEGDICDTIYPHLINYKEIVRKLDLRYNSLLLHISQFLES